MAPQTLPQAHALPSLPDEDKIKVLDLLFEPSRPLHTLALPLLAPSASASYPDLIAAVHARLTRLHRSSDDGDVRLLHAILESHPRLGARRVDSAQSQAEQAQLRAADGEGDEAARLAALNAEYERRFPGLRYVVFVNGRGRDLIMDDMRRRIDGGNPVDERRAAIDAMCQIAADRAVKLSS